MRFVTFILKNLLRRKLRSALTAVGVAVAVTAVVALLGISNGFERSFTDLYLKRGVDLIVVRAGVTDRLTSRLDESLSGRLKELPGVRDVAPGLMDVVSFEKPPIDGVPLVGWNADNFMFAEMHLLAGRWLEPNEPKAAVLGTVLAQNLRKKIGDQVDFYGEPFTLVGIYESFSVFENGSALVALSELRRLMNEPDRVSGFHLALIDSPDKDALVQAVRKSVENLTDDKGRPLHLAALPTRDFVSSTAQIRMSHAVAWVTSAIALFIGAVGILNTMIMSVFERTHEIGILRAIGWRKTRVMRMILAESFLLSLAGAALGVLGAILLTRFLSTFPATNGYVHGTVAPTIIAEGLLIAVVVGLIGGFYPAYRGAQLLPTEALRHE
jgi:putative ABC transport system permease protein